MKKIMMYKYDDGDDDDDSFDYVDNAVDDD
jgi:hypothetical protein